MNTSTRDARPCWLQCAAATSLALLLGCTAAHGAGSVPGKNPTTQAVLDPSALENLLQRAREGNADAQTALGILLHEGKEIAKDEAAGTASFAKTAAQGHAVAQTIVGIAYALGKGVPQNDRLAGAWFGKAAAQNNTDALVHLADMHESGRGVPANVNRAFALRRHAAELGNSQAQVQLGTMYGNGTGVKPDDKMAFEWYLKSALQGNTAGQNNVGYMLHLGRGARANEAEAAEWYRKAAVGGDSVAQNNLARLYASGVAVMRDYKQAARWFRKAAEQGHASAQISLAYLYRNGDGVPQNDVMASEWFRMAAMQGDFSAMIMMGSLYENGRGVAANKETAAEWRRKAVEQQMAHKKNTSGVSDAKPGSMSREALFLLQQEKQVAMARGPALTQAANVPKKSDGRLAAELILTDDPAALKQDWESPKEHLTLKTVESIRSSQAIHGFVIFTGCTANSEQKCTIGLSYRVFFPDGSLHSMSAPGFPLNNASAEPGPTLSFGIPVTITPEQPLGVYVIEARVRDLNSDSTLELQRTFKVSR